jgi:hypothetical protein
MKAKFNQFVKTGKRVQRSQVHRPPYRDLKEAEYVSYEQTGTNARRILFTVGSVGV